MIRNEKNDFARKKKRIKRKESVEVWRLVTQNEKFNNNNLKASFSLNEFSVKQPSSQLISKQNFDNFIHQWASILNLVWYKSKPNRSELRLIVLKFFSYLYIFSNFYD